MLQKGREGWYLRWLCAFLLLTACCFRTAAVWDKPSAPKQEQQFATLPYSRTEAENAATPLQEAIRYDASVLQIENRAGADFDAEILLAAPLTLPQTDEPLVLIVHTHATEAYSETEGYRSEDAAQNMLRIGQEIAKVLNENGIPTLHDTTMHDAQGYDAAYERTEDTISAYLEQFPSICMVIDVHRDAAQASDGSQLARTTVLGGQEMAQMLLVMGTDTAELPHPNWEQNLSFALKLQAYIAQDAPDLMRPILLRAARYNEHLTPQSILLEVGTAGNTQAQALRSAQHFAEKLSNLIKASQ